MTDRVSEDWVATGWERGVPIRWIINSPDLNDTGRLRTSPGYSWNSGRPVSSQDGGTWQNIFGVECFRQEIHNLVIGRNYYFSFEYCSQAIQLSANNYYNTPALPDLTLTGVSSYTDPQVVGTLYNWQRHTTLVTATDTVLTINVAIKDGVESYLAFDGFYLSETAPLPVILAGFSVSANKNNAILSWATTSELNSDRFVIEKSVDGNSWQQIGNLPATGYSTIKKYYSFTDNNFYQNTYYRLKLYDKDNSFSTSKILLARFGNNTEAIVLYPNPVASVIKIDLGMNAENWNSAEVFNTAGILCTTRKLLPGTQQVNIDVTTLAKGIYFVKLRGKNNAVVNKSFVIQ